MGSPVAKDPPSNAVLIFHPEFCYALNKRSLLDCAQRVTHSIERPLCQKGHPGSRPRGFRTAAAVPFPVVRGRRFNRQIPPSARWRGPKIAELLNVLLKRHSLRGVAGR